MQVNLGYSLAGLIKELKTTNKLTAAKKIGGIFENSYGRVQSGRGIVRVSGSELPKLINALVTAANDENFHVRQSATAAIGCLVNEGTVNIPQKELLKLLNKLVKLLNKEEHEYVKSNIACTIDCLIRFGEDKKVIIPESELPALIKELMKFSDDKCFLVQSHINDAIKYLQRQRLIAM